MTKRLPLHALDPAEAADGNYALTVSGGKVAGLATAGGGGSLTVQDEDGNVSTAVTQIDFQGAGVTATAGTGEVVVTIPGGAGGSGATATRDVCSANTAINSTTITDITGITRSVTVAGTTDVYIVHVTLDAEMTTTSTAYLVAKLNVGGTDQTSEMIYRANGLSGRSAIAQTWLITGLAAGAKTFKVRASLTASSGAYTVGATHSNMTIIKL